MIIHIYYLPEQTELPQALGRQNLGCSHSQQLAETTKREKRTREKQERIKRGGWGRNGKAERRVLRLKTNFK